MKQITATVVHNHPLSKQRRQSGSKTLLGFHLIWLNCPQIEESQPGQFLMVRCGNESFLPRPFSIHRANEDEIALWIAIWEGGKGTQWLSNLQAGDRLELVGPLGNGYEFKPDSQKLLLLAGGVGIAPLHFLAQEAVKRSCSVTMIHGASAKINLYPEEVPRGIELITATEDGSAGHHGLITDLLPKFANDADQIFACGPEGMYRTMANMPELKGKNVQVSLEIMMACGAGACYGCTIKTRKGLKQVCRDGPVFDLEDIIWDG